MAQLVFEFGSETIDPVVEAIKMAIGSSRYTLRVQSTDSQEWIISQESLEQAATRAKSNILSSISLHPEHPWVRYALVLCPFFAGGSRSTWMGTIEITTGDYQQVWNLLLRMPGLLFVCLGFEEGVDLSEMEKVSVATFPWHDPFLVVGAVRADGNGWHIQKGARYPESQRQIRGRSDRH